MSNIEPDKITYGGYTIKGNADRLSKICQALKTNSTNLKTAIDTAKGYIGKRYT